MFCPLHLSRELKHSSTFGGVGVLAHRVSQHGLDTVGGASSSPGPPGGVKFPGQPRFLGSAQCGCGLTPQGVASGKRRSGKPVVIPRQRWQPRVPADKRSALAGVLGAAGQPRGLCSSCQLPPVITPHRGPAAPGRSSEGSPARSPEGMVPGVSGCTPHQLLPGLCSPPQSPPPPRLALPPAVLGACANKWKS